MTSNAHLKITIALSDYDHVRDFASGRVRAEGLDVLWLTLPVEEIFFRFLKYREWDVSEISMAKYCSLVAQGFEDMVAIPVFPSRVVRLSSIYLRQGSGIRSPEDLRGKRVGVPEWAQTAAVYTRGWLMHEVGIPLQEIDWYQAGVNQPGRREKVELSLPPGVRYTPVPDRSLTDLLLSGDVDAVFSAHPPEPFEQGRPGIMQLFPDYREPEQRYFQKTGILPIMHTVVIRRELLDRHPWVAMNLFKAFEQAKENSVRRALDMTATRFPIPWCYAFAREMQAMTGQELFPYGVEPNRTTLSAFLSYAYEQGVCPRLLEPEELFYENVLSSVRV
jgi:4,5-dihydroxyphthalate decarboxylase